MKQRPRPSPSSRDATERTQRTKALLVDVPSPFPVVERVHGKPRWWHRLRGLVGMTVLVGLLGVLVAAAAAVLVALLVVALVSTIT